MTESADTSEPGQREWVLAALTHFEGPLLRFASGLVGSGHAADVVQDTFLELYRADRGQVEGHLSAWLFTVCKRRAIDVVRERGRLAALEEDDGMQSPDSGPAARVERQESMSRVERALERLTERDRQVVILKFSAGLRYKEIAEVMELSASNVGFILHTAIKILREELGDAAGVLLVSKRSVS
ncbi:MAG: sigma-70 family RNA polymerase sigma factor [Myxococcales bacterium]|nr:sigma-70 family RNA polymerase sigma factor [Myxococcales bacterium]